MAKILFLPLVLKDVGLIHQALKLDKNQPSPCEKNPTTPLAECEMYFHPQCSIQEKDIAKLLDQDMKVGNGVSSGNIRFKANNKEGFVRKGATWIVFPDSVDLASFDLNLILEKCRNAEE